MMVTEDRAEYDRIVARLPKRECLAGYAWVESGGIQMAEDVFFDGQAWRPILRHHIGFNIPYPFQIARKVAP